MMTKLVKFEVPTLHAEHRVLRSARALARVPDVTVEWRLMDGLPHVFPPDDELGRCLLWLDTTRCALDGEEPPAFCPLVVPTREEEAAAAAAAAAARTDDGQETGGGGGDAAGAPARAEEEETLAALLQRAGLAHLGKALAAEELDLPLLREMRDFTTELSELGASDDELRRLERAVHPPPSAEVDSDDDGGGGDGREVLVPLS